MLFFCEVSTIYYIHVKEGERLDQKVYELFH